MSKKLRIVLMSAFVFAMPMFAMADEPLTKPFKAIELGEAYLHPDGMTVNPKTGDIILAAPTVGDKGNAWLLKIDADDNVTPYFELPAHPETGRVTPLGISFGPDGNLYVADSQCLGGNPNHKSRILRVTHQNGKPVTCETVVWGIVQANGLEIHNGKIYVAETQIDPAIVEMPMTSGVFCFDIKLLEGHVRRSGKPLFVDAYKRDPHFIFDFQTADADRNGTQKVGANGIGLAKDGTLYVANFGDRKVIEVKFDATGKKVVSHRDVNEGGPNESVDGLKVCPKGYIFFADYVGNAVWVLNPKNGKLVLIAQNAINPDADAKKAGALDRCSEVCLRGDKLYVANIDLESFRDGPHTVSVIDLKGIDFDSLLK
ncbi:MAG: SMP-30/gluconolactonase/LRE family protein [Planctomycetaceae bacterium]|jgi:sugar lactone lactonase YvrE|nr:SMP-30/gluconolactonase/LRE family protein [Planctomycetaceae bacterium]